MNEVVQLPLSWLISTSISLLVATVGAFWALARMLINQNRRHIDEKFNAIAATLGKQDENSRRLERELLELRAELPNRYVLRDDHNRVQATLQVAIDSMRQSLDRYLTERSRP